MKDNKLLLKILYAVIRISGVVIVILLLYKLIFWSYDFGYRIFSDEPMEAGIGRTISVAIVDGKSVKEVGELLENKGLIRNSTLFVFQEKFSEYEGLMKPGVYELSTSMTPQEIIEYMATEQIEEEEEEEGNSTGASIGDDDEEVSDEELENPDITDGEEVSGDNTDGGAEEAGE
jgi:UPF0755 protein